MGKKILIVDDEEDIRTSIRMILEKQGYTISDAADGKIALEIIDKEDFDLVILDVMMPELSGWDTLTEIIKRKPDYAGKIMFLSVVEISDERKKELIQKGMVDYMTKPFELNTLVAKIGEILG